MYFLLLGLVALAAGGPVATHSAHAMRSDRWPAVAEYTAGTAMPNDSPPASRRTLERVAKDVAEGIVADVVAELACSGSHTTVTPCTGSKTVAQGVTRSVSFTVKNTGGSSFPYAFTCSVVSPVISCTRLPGASIIGPGATKTVSVTFTVNSTLATGSVSLKAQSDGDLDEATGKYNVTVEDSVHLTPGVSSAPHNGDIRIAGACAHHCNDAVLSYTTPAFVTLNQARALTLVYRSNQAYPTGMVQLNVTDNSPDDPDRISLKLQRTDGSFVAFANDSTEIFFQGASGTSRLAALFKADTIPTGVRNYTAIVTSYWGSPTTTQRQAPGVPVRVLFVNEKDSPYGAGWSIAGLQRVHAHADSVLITEGDGSVAFFRRVSCSGGSSTCDFASPLGDFSKVIQYTSPGATYPYVRKYRDSSQVAFRSDGWAAYADDRLLNTTIFAYDASGRLTTITDEKGKTITLGYETAGGSWKAGTLRWVDDFTGRRVWIGVNASNDLQEISDGRANPALRPTYDAWHRVTSFLDVAGSRYAFEYDYTRKVRRDTLPQVMANGLSVKPVIEYRSIERVMLVDDGSGLGTSASPAPRVRADTVAALVISPEADTTRYTVSRWGQAARVTDPLGNLTIFDWGDAGLLHFLTYPSGASDAFTYDGPQVKSIKLAGQDTTYRHYGAYGQPDSIWGPNQAKQRIFLGYLGRADSVRIADTVRVRYFYDLTQRIDSVADRLGHFAKYHYDATFGNLDSTRSDGSRWSRVGFDAFGRVSWSAASGRARMWVEYDGLNRPQKSWTEGLSPGDTIRTFWGVQFADSVKDAKGQVYRDSVNALGWVTRSYDPDPAKGSLAYAYNRNGWVTSWTNRRGQTVNHAYDRVGRLVKKSGTNTVTDSFAYSPNGLRVVGINTISIDSIFTSSLGWTDSVVTLIAGQRYRTKYTPDTRQRLQSMSVAGPAGGPTFASRSLGWSASTGLLNSVTVNGTTVSYYYNAEWQRDAVTWPTGLTKSHLFTSHHQPYSTSFNDNGVNPSLRRGYGLDSLGRIASVNRNVAGGYEIVQFKYDGATRLQGSLTQTVASYNTTCPPNANYGFTCTASVPTTITYDGAGNVLTSGTSSGAYAVGNRDTLWNSVTYTYDADGNRASQSSPSKTYGWSAEGLLATVTEGATTLQYDYNAFGQLVRKRRNGTMERHFLWDRGNLLAELDAGATQRIAEYVHPGGLDQPLALVTGASAISKVRFLEQDRLGNVIGVFDDPSVYQTITYTPTGSVQALGGTLADTNRLRWKGLVWEGDVTNLYYVRNRWYDPETGRFMTEDPIGLTGGINAYLFARNDPINGRDPSGLTGDVVADTTCTDRHTHTAPNGTTVIHCGTDKTILPPMTVTANAPVPGRWFTGATSFFNGWEGNPNAMMIVAGGGAPKYEFYVGEVNSPALVRCPAVPPRIDHSNVIGGVRGPIIAMTITRVSPQWMADRLFTGWYAGLGLVETPLLQFKSASLFGEVNCLSGTGIFTGASP